jgi:serine/threonine protein kinase
MKKLDAYLIPEPAIWHIFETLIKAGLVMEQGAEGPPPPPWWVGGPVVHLDLKPGNVFIGNEPEPTEDSDNFAMYPRFKVADFGHSIDDRRNPRADRFYRDRGTPFFMSPEKWSVHEYPGQNQDPLNTKTNVWGVGITLMAMMNLNENAGALDFAEATTDERDPNLVPKFKARAARKYSARLRDMVVSCVGFRQANRPTFDDLLTQLRAATNFQRGLVPIDHARGARHATADNLPGTWEPLRFLGTDSYVVGLTLPPGNRIPAI